MAEFDSSAFSAVDSFFAIDKDSQGKQEATNKGSLSGKTRRLGVGAAAKPKTTAIDTTSRLLQVGKKKRKNDDEDDEDVVPDHGEEDEEEDLGRSGIATEPQASDQDNLKQSDQKSKKKKKKKAGKKERQKLKEENPEATDQPPLETTPSDEENKPVESSSTDSPKAEAQDNNNKDTDQEPSTRKPKRKRRKVRSRQKNIYKDNRSVEQRPDHLVPGGYSYQGRPMTSATRSKLKTKQILPSDSNQQTNDSFRANWDTTDQELEDNGVPVLSNAKELGRKEIAANKPKRGKAKQKKSKYKNIQ